MASAWSLTMEIANSAGDLSGTAVVVLSNGRTLDYLLSGKHRYSLM